MIEVSIRDVNYLRGVQDCAEHARMRLEAIRKKHIVMMPVPDRSIVVELPDLLALREALADVEGDLDAWINIIAGHRAERFGVILDELMMDREEPC